MEFRVVLPLAEADPTTPPERLVLPAIIPLPAPVRTRQLSLVELESETVKVIEDNGNVVLACDDPDAVAFGPTEARLGSVMNDGGMLMGMGLKWEEPVTENPAVGDTEVWEIYNFTMDAHPIHVHEVAFEVVDRQSVNMETGDLGPVVPRQAWEDGLKDTVIAYPGEITRIKALFATPGQYVWHCHIVEHEDNEMMRPYRIGPEQPGQPMPSMPPMPMAGTETVTTSASSAWRKIRRQRRK
jgi:FtsP/CotA-like multicopper oxidase with cupredoxin domain